MTPVMISLVLATSIAALTFVVGTVTAERADVRESLRRLEGYQIQDVRDQEMLAPISERVFTPLLEGLTGVARRFTPAGFGNWLRARCEEAGLHHCSAHGLRKACATALAEGGASTHEIAAVTGHTSLEEIERYTRAAQKKMMADAAIAKLKR